LEFQSISEKEAKKSLSLDQENDVDEAEKEYLLEYYFLVREGKTAYVLIHLCYFSLGIVVKNPQTSSKFTLTSSSPRNVARPRTVRIRSPEITTSDVEWTRLC